MNKTEFIRQLRDTAAEIKPLTEATSAGALVWDGTKYATGEVKQADPYALSWWSILGTIADLIEAQESPLSPRQLAYIQRILFGGMGSLNDLYFDAKILGARAKAINERLNQKRQALFAAFKD